MRKSHKKSTDSNIGTQREVERNIAARLGWTVQELRWVCKTAREYVKVHGAEALLGIK